MKWDELLGGTSQEKEDRQLLRRVAARDPAALGCLYDRYSGLVYSLALRVLRDALEAEDIVSKTFWQVWQQAARYDGARGRVMAWMVMIARSRALDARRARARGRETAEEPEILANAPAASVHPDDAVSAAERRLHVQGALRRLPDAQRQALELAFFEGLSHSEISERTGEPLGTIKTRIRCGMLSLREHLRPLSRGHRPAARTATPALLRSVRSAECGMRSAALAGSNSALRTP